MNSRFWRVPSMLWKPATTTEKTKILEFIKKTHTIMDLEESMHGARGMKRGIESGFKEGEDVEFFNFRGIDKVARGYRDWHNGIIRYWRARNWRKDHGLRPVIESTFSSPSMLNKALFPATRVETAIIAKLIDKIHNYWEIEELIYRAKFIKSGRKRTLQGFFQMYRAKFIKSGRKPTVQGFFPELEEELELDEDFEICEGLKQQYRTWHNDAVYSIRWKAENDWHMLRMRKQYEEDEEVSESCERVARVGMRKYRSSYRYLSSISDMGSSSFCS